MTYFFHFTPNRNTKGDLEIEKSVLDKLLFKLSEQWNENKMNTFCEQARVLNIILIAPFIKSGLLEVFKEPIDCPCLWLW